MSFLEAQLQSRKKDKKMGKTWLKHIKGHKNCSLEAQLQSRKNIKKKGKT
jgi:hypothetical protein